MINNTPLLDGHQKVKQIKKPDIREELRSSIANKPLPLSYRDRKGVLIFMIKTV